MPYPKACEIPTLFEPGPRWLVELGPTSAERFIGSAPDKDTAIGCAMKKRSLQITGQTNGGPHG